MRRFPKRLLALLLALLFCVSLFPAAALAEDEGEEPRAAEGEGPCGDEETPEAPGDEAPGGGDEEGAPSSPTAPRDDTGEDGLTPAEDEIPEDPDADPEALPPEGDEIEAAIASGDCGDSLIWTLSDAGVLTIAGSGDMWDWKYDAPAPWHGYWDKIVTVRIMSGVTSIGSEAFCDCGYLTSVAIPEGVTSIGSEAFFDCDNLTSVTIPEGVTSIGNGVFSNCSSLTSVTISEGVTSIGPFAFSDCNRLTDIWYGSTKADWEQLGVVYDRYSVTVRCSDGDIAPADAMYCGDDLTWSFDEETGALSISGTGDMWYFSWEAAPWHAHHDEILSVEICPGVTSIGGRAFVNCSSLTSVTIPEGVASIEIAAFSGCSSLTSVTIPEGVTSIGAGAFFKCRSLTSVTITASVTSIVVGAFYNCSSLTEIRFEGAAPSLGDNCFNNVTATAYYPANDPSWTEDVRQNYGGTITWVGYGPIASGQCGDDLTWALDEDGVLTISGTGDMWDFIWYYDGDAYSSTVPWYDHRDEIRQVQILEGVTHVGNNAFIGCNELTEISLPESLCSIGTAAFQNCGFNGISLSSCLTSIGDYAFRGCWYLTEITIPESVAHIGKQAFIGCSHLEAIHVAEGNRNYASVDGILFSGDMRTLICCPEGKSGTITIPEGVTDIGESAFYYSSLTGVTLPAGLTSIGDCAFATSALTEITLPEGLTSIGDWAFGSCVFTEITIPVGVTSIGSRAFSGCRSLTRIEFPASLRQVGEAALMECGALTDIYFGGTQAAWEELDIGYDRYSVAVHCLDGDLTPADSDACGDNLIWSLNSSGVLTIAGTGDMWNFSAYRDGSEAVVSTAPWYDRRDEILQVRIMEGVTSVGDNAFGANWVYAWPGTSCANLSSVSLPSTLRSIGFCAFSGCRALKEVVLPDGLSQLGMGAFCSSGLERINLPSGLSELGPATFASCSSLTEITIPASVTRIEGAFYCSGLKEIRFLGSAPSFIVCSTIVLGRFTYVTATAYYPDNDDTWTEEVRQNYDGTITWIAYTPEPSHVPGDINGDGNVDGIDLVRLRKYLAGDDVEINAANTDVNGDGRISGLDLIRLRKYLAGDSVTLD